MRWILAVIALSTALTGRAEEPSVEILGVKITQGMSEEYVRTAFPQIHCAGKGPSVEHDLDLCSISDGVPPGADGEVTFQNGRVLRASRNWFFPEDSDPFDALLMLNDILTRLTGEDSAVCAKIQTYTEGEPKTTNIVLPEKILTIQMHTMKGGHAFIRESLRVNPVPASYKVRGQKMRGTEWCAYIN